MSANRSAGRPAEPSSASSSAPPAPAGGSVRLRRATRRLRSGLFLAFYALYLIVYVELGQRLIILPAIRLAPRRRQRIVGRWMRAQARFTVTSARRLANFRVLVRGAPTVIPSTGAVIVMNHQSVMDIPIGVALTTAGPTPLIPTRDRYARGIPGISLLTRIAGYPFVRQARRASRAELLALSAAADSVAAGDRSLLIYPEGHRTSDGNLGAFMRSGLRLIIARARCPVYCVVTDGMTHLRTFADALTTFADTTAQVIVIGPFAPPADAAALDAFIDDLHARMVTALDTLRHEPPAGAAPHPRLLA